MSCNYAEGLSPYENKGVLGIPERFDDDKTIEEKCNLLVNWILKSKHVVLHTGAGISTSAGIPDFRGPNGVWTLERQGKRPNTDISFSDAIPTKTHMAIKKLIDEKYVHFVISQNIDGLHLRSGIRREHIAELHGNMFVEYCPNCDTHFVRNQPTPSVGRKCLQTNCHRYIKGRPCRGKLFDTILDWEHNLPDKDLEMSDYHSAIADLNICLGTTLQIVPSGNLPLRNQKFGGKIVIINLQPTKHDKKANLVINTYVDSVMNRIMKKLGLEIPEYQQENDPTKSDPIQEWNTDSADLKKMKTLYEEYYRIYKQNKTDQPPPKKNKYQKTESGNETKEKVVVNQ